MREHFQINTNVNNLSINKISFQQRKKYAKCEKKNKKKFVIYRKKSEDENERSTTDSKRAQGAR